MRLAFTAFIILILAGPKSGAQFALTGDLTAHIDSIVSAMPGATPAGMYLQPSSSSRTLWRDIIQDVLAGDYETANSNAATKNYRVVLFTDDADNPGRMCVILERTPASTSRYWGTFVFDPQPHRPQLVIQCPHGRYDSNTGKEGFRVFQQARARAYFVNGIHRCNGLTASPCDGVTSACSSENQAYRYSDQAHVVLSTFQITTEEMLAVYPDLIFIQPHGFGKGDSDPDIIMSNGSTYAPPIDYLVDLRDNLLLQDASLTFKIAHLDDWTRLIGRTNVQGRLINDSPEPCGTYATSSVGRFLHLEQARSKLRDTEANWYKLANAVAMTFPATGQIVSVQSGEWWDDYTWSSGEVPTPGDDIQIMAGHAISIDDASAECRTISFNAPTASIDMNANSQLSVFGDFVIFDGSHDAFEAGWSGYDAYLRFAGSANQVLSGWAPNASGAAFRDAIVDKTGGRVITEGNGMCLVTQNSLELRQGMLVIGPDDTLAVIGHLDLSSGTLDNSDPSATLTVADGTLITISGGAIVSPPEFLGVVDIAYEDALYSLSTGAELPAGPVALNNLDVNGAPGIILTQDATVNGMLVLTGGGLSTGDQIISLGESAGIDESFGNTVQGKVETTRDLNQSVGEDFGQLGLTIWAEGAEPGPTTVLRVTGAPPDLGDGVSGAARFFDILPSNNTALDASLTFAYTESELNGLPESSLSLFSSDNNGISWDKRGGVVDPVGNTVTLVGIDRLSRWTIGASAAETCCADRVGDANGLGGDEPTIGDVSVMIDAKFISGTCEGLIPCLPEADMNQSGGSDPACHDITVGDVSILIDYLFITGPSLVIPNCL